MSTPRKPRRTTPAKAVGNALTAAARRIRPRSVKRSNQYGDWSDESWYFFSEVGELHYLATTVANAMSMVELYIAKRDVQGGWLRIDDDNDPAVIALDALAGDSPTGMAEMLRRFGLNLFVAGDCYLVGHPPEDPTGMPPALGYIDPALPQQQPQGLDLATLCWKVYSAAEVRFDAGKVKVAGRDFPEDDVIAVRVWRPHPRNMNFADAPVRSALPILRELVALTKYVSAVLDSRFAGAGIVWMPEGAEMLGAGAPEDEADSDPFLERIMDAMIEPIKNRDAASSVVPIFVTLPDDTAFQPNYMSFAGTLDGTAKELRDEAIRRLALSLDAPPEVLTGMGDTSHWCVDDATQVLTRSGWRSQADLVIGEEVYTLNHESGLAEWQPILNIYRADVVCEPMVRMRSGRHDSLTTFEHRWPVQHGKPGLRKRRWTTSREMYYKTPFGAEDSTQTYTYIPLSAPSAELPTETKYSDALVEMVAWYYTEGSEGIRLGRNSARATIYQSHAVNPEKCLRIERALTALFGPASEKFSSGGRFATPESVERNAEARQLHAQGMSIVGIARELGVSASTAGKYLRKAPSLRDDVPRWRVRRDDRMSDYILNSAASDVLTSHAPLRMVSLDFIHSLTLAQLELFIHISVIADGHYIGGTTPMFGQKNPAMNAAFELAGILSGKSVYTTDQTGMGASANGPREKTQNVVTIGQNDLFAPRGRNFSEEEYTGTVWCPTTANGTWLARREGSVFFTGNSAWLVAEDMIKLHVLPPIGLVRDALVREYLRPILEANGVANPEDYTIEADASALTLRPNRSTEAMALYDKGLITDASAREALGFGEEDAPDLPAAVDEAVSRAMDMVAQAPHLLVPVTLPELVAQIREVMGGPKAPEVAVPPVATPAPANPTPVVEPGPAQSPQPGQGAAA